MWEENSTATLMIDGKVVACVSEERFTRAKNDECYPKKSIEYVLKAGGIKAEEIDIVAFTGHVWKPYYILTRRYSNSSVEDYLKEQYEYWYPRFYEQKNTKYFDVFKDKLDFKQYPGNWEEVFEYAKKDDEGVRKLEGESTVFFKDFRKKVVSQHLGINQEKIIFIDHHKAHAFYAYYGSPFRNDALVVTADAWGDDVSATVNQFKGGNFQRISSSKTFILGRLYRYITLLLGMKPNEHEYKVMGLAPYAKEKYFQKALDVFEETQHVEDLDFVFKNKPNDLYFYFKEKLEGQRFDAISGALQKYTEKILVDWIKNSIKKTGLNRICFSGGTAMNVKATMEINSLEEVEEIFVCPSPGDESLAMGSAYVAMADYCSEKNIDANEILKPISNAYLGPEITDQEIEELLKTEDIEKKYIVTRNFDSNKVAYLLDKGLIIGRASGRSEFGARALGNRSIIADPRSSEIIKIINEKVKNRDFWMPFAATILEKRANDYLLGYKKCGAPFMTNAFQTTKLGRKHLQAGLHPYDSTCRPQVLRSGDNDDYEKIILAFENITGVGGVLNTSFNLHGEPIIQTASEAYRVFLLSDIDCLILNNILIEKKNN